MGAGKVNGAKEVCGSMRERKKNTKKMWWNDMVKVTVERKEAAWKMVLETWDKVKKDVREFIDKKRGRLKCEYISARRR